MGIQGINNTQIPINNNGNHVKIKRNFVTNSNQPTEDTFKKQGMSKKKKAFIGAGIATAAIAIGILVNKHNRAKAVKEVPQEFRTIFEELKNETGENFVNKAYSKLKQYMKLDGIAPEKIGCSGKDSATSILGGFNPTKNTIEYSQGFFDKFDRATQFELLAHELKHAEQTSKIIRSGKLEEYAQAWAEYNVRNAQNDPLNVNFMQAHKAAKEQGKEKEFLEEVLNTTQKDISDSMKQNNQNTLKMPKFEPGSPEYQDAERYIEATRNYEEFGSDEYINNPLEKEAYAFGGQMKKFFKLIMG